MSTTLVMPSITVDCETPDGSMFVTIMENDDGYPIRIQVIIGKAGTAVMAWAQSISELMTTVLENSGGINKIIETMSNQTSGSPSKRVANGSRIRSGPEGIVYCLMTYKRMKFQEFKAQFDGYDDGLEIEGEPRLG